MLAIQDAVDRAVDLEDSSRQNLFPARRRSIERLRELQEAAGDFPSQLERRQSDRVSPRGSGNPNSPKLRKSMTLAAQKKTRSPKRGAAASQPI